jgi:hypothetical protein
MEILHHTTTKHEGIRHYEVLISERRATLRVVFDLSMTDKELLPPDFFLPDLSEEAPSWLGQHVKDDFDKTTDFVFDGKYFDPSLKGHRLLHIGSCYLNLDDPSIKHEWADASTWIFGSRSDFGQTRFPIRAINITAESSLVKRPKRYYEYKTGRFNMLRAHVKFATDNFFDAVWSLSHNPESVVRGVSLGKEDDIFGNHIIGPHLPQLNISGPEKIGPNKTEKITIQIVDSDKITPLNKKAIIYMEEISGILPIKRIETDENGQAVIPVVALGMSTGDTVIVRAGYKYLSNCGSIKIPVK